MKPFNTEHDDSEILVTSLAFCAVAFCVLILVGVLIIAGKLLLVIVPGSAFFQGMIFALLAIGVWSVTVSTCLFSVMTIAYPRPTTLILNTVLLLLTIFAWVKFAAPYPSYTDAILDSLSQMFVAIVSPTTWMQYRLVYDALRLSNGPPS